MTKPVDEPKDNLHAWFAPEAWVGTRVVMLLLTLDAGKVGGVQVTHQSWAIGETVEGALASFKRRARKLRDSILSYEIVTDGTAPKVCAGQPALRGRPPGRLGRPDIRMREGYRLWSKKKK